MAEKRPRSSFVWDHFVWDEVANKVTCQTCKAVLAFNNTTSSMIKHLQAKHPYKLSTGLSEAADAGLVIYINIIINFN